MLKKTVSLQTPQSKLQAARSVTVVGGKWFWIKFFISIIPFVEWIMVQWWTIQINKRDKLMLNVPDRKFTCIYDAPRSLSFDVNSGKSTATFLHVNLCSRFCRGFRILLLATFQAWTKFSLFDIALWLLCLKIKKIMFPTCESYVRVLSLIPKPRIQLVNEQFLGY